MTRFCEKGALERFFLVGEIFDKAEAMVAAASSFHVDAVIDGIEDALRDQGVPYGSFVEGLRAKARARHREETENVRRVCGILDGLR